MIDIIYNEDCIEGMKRIPDGSVDAIICDPPFGITDAPFDKRIPFEPMWEQFKLIGKCFGMNGYGKKCRHWLFMA